MRLGLFVTVLLSAFVLLYFVDQEASAGANSVEKIDPKPMADLEFEKTEALSRLNALREAAGLPRFVANKSLEKAAQAHADYLVANRAKFHMEKSSGKFFTGKTPMERALFAGYPARFTGENLSTKNTDAADSIDGLFSAIYHRFGFLNPLFDEIGIGIAQDSAHPGNSAFVYLMGNREIARLCLGRSYKGRGSYVLKACKNPKHRIDARAYKQARKLRKEMSTDIIKYPYDGQSDVPPAFYNETPDPLPNFDVSGYPVSIEFNFPNSSKKIRLLSFQLFENGSKEITDVKLLDKHSDPHHKLSDKQFALLPLERLKYDTEYRVRVKYKRGKMVYVTKWRFHTLTPTEKLITIRDKNTKLRLEAGKSYWLYFEPLNPHDLLGTMQFPADLYVSFVDSNTMRVVIDKDRSRSFEIKGSGRRVRIEIE